MGNDHDRGDPGALQRSLWDHGADLVLDVGHDGKVRATNPAARVWIGAATIGLQELVHPQDAARLTAALTGEQPERGDFRFAHLPPEAGWRVAELVAADTTATGAVIVLRDVTHEHRALATLHAHRDVLTRLAWEEPMPAVLDALARSVEQASGDARAVIVVARGADLELAAAPSLRSDASAAFARWRGGAGADRFPAAGPLSGELAELASKHGLGFGWAAPVVADDEPLAVLLLFPGTKRFPSTSEQRALEAAVPLAQVAIATDRARAVARSTARSDLLTGVLGRLAFLDELGHLARRSRDVLGVLVVQVDELAALNERAGFAAGDAVLTTVAARLGATVRGRDILGRCSGTRFAVACSSPGPAASMPEFAARVERSLAEPVVVDGAVLPIAVRVGSATRRGRIEDPGAILRDAERAVQPAAGAGRPGDLAGAVASGDEVAVEAPERRGQRRSGAGHRDR